VTGEANQLGQTCKRPLEVTIKEGAGEVQIAQVGPTKGRPVMESTILEGLGVGNNSLRGSRTSKAELADLFL
jgi:hypothetical protein